MAGLECFEPGRGLLPLGAGGPPRVAFGVVLPIGMLSTGSGEGCPLLGLGDCLGTGVGEAAVVGCFPWEKSSVAGQVEATEVLAPIGGDMR